MAWWLGYSSWTINSNGVFTDVVVGNRAYDHQLIWGDTTSANRSLGMNHEFAVSDALTITFDYHSSTALKNGTELPNELGMSTTKRANVTHTNGGSSGFINSFAYDEVFEASDYYISNIYARDAYKKNDMNQYQLIGEWVNLESGLVASVDWCIQNDQ